MIAQASESPEVESHFLLRMADLRRRDGMIQQANQTAARLHRLGNAPNAKQVYASTYNAHVSQVMDRMLDGNLGGALEITRIVLHDNAQQEPLKRLPKQMRELFEKLEHTLCEAMGRLQ